MSLDSTSPKRWQYFRRLFTKYALRDREGVLDSLAMRLEDAEEAFTIMRAKGYDGATLADMVKKVQPANLRHS